MCSARGGSSVMFAPFLTPRGQEGGREEGMVRWQVGEMENLPLTSHLRLLNQERELGVGDWQVEFSFIHLSVIQSFHKARAGCWACEAQGLKLSSAFCPGAARGVISGARGTGAEEMPDFSWMLMILVLKNFPWLSHAHRTTQTPLCPSKFSTVGSPTSPRGSVDTPILPHWQLDAYPLRKTTPSAGITVEMLPLPGTL